ncbi:MAG: glycosyltransferase family 39 protein [candidate division Zixibacteria bacterium]|nr:glycosyltransferase family 39 protein [candidate division Zixibacteria bacterium]
MPDKSRRFLLALIALCAVLYFSGIAVPSLTDPDDVFYAESAKEMADSGSMLTPVIFEHPQFEKPPLYLWFLVISFKLLGVSAVSARLVSALFGLLSVAGTFLFMRKLIDEQAAFITAMILASAVWWIGLAHVVLTDMVFSTFVAFALYSFFLWHKFEKRGYLLLFALFSALATLTKGPLGLLLPLSTAAAFLVVIRSSRRLWRFLLGRWWLLWLVFVLPWFLYAGFKYGNAFLWEFFVNCHWNRLIHAEHHQFNTLYFYPAVITVGLIPWTCFLPFVGAGFRRLKTEHVFALTWFVVMFVFFTVAQSKLSTYISPVFPALAMLIGLSLTGGQIVKYRVFAVAALLAIAGIGLSMAPLFLNKDYPDFVVPGLKSFGVIAIGLFAAAVFVVRQRFHAALTASLIGMIGFAVIAPMTVFPKLETALTESNLQTLVAENHYTNQPILCNSLYVRGVYFYSGNPVIVMAGSKNPFWSKHPVTVLSEDQELRGFIDSRDSLMCVFTNRDLERFDRLTSSERENTILSRNIDRLVVLSIKRAGLTAFRVDRASTVTRTIPLSR